MKLFWSRAHGRAANDNSVIRCLPFKIAAHRDHALNLHWKRSMYGGCVWSSSLESVQLLYLEGAM